MTGKNSRRSVWSQKQLVQWHLIKQAYEADTPAVTQDKDVECRRYHVQQEMINLLDAFLSASTSLAEFNAVFQQKTRGPWSVFRLGGMSGAMFLRKLMKYVPDQHELAGQLRTALHVPQTTREAKQQMTTFMQFLETIITSQETTRGCLQPARTPFFLSAWWHLQEREQWPLFFPIVHTVMMYETDQPSGSEDPVEMYFAFQIWFLALAQELNLSSWKLEHISTWYGLQAISHSDGEQELSRLLKKRSHYLFAQEHEDRCQQLNGVMHQQTCKDMEISREEEQNGSCHTHIQWLLAQLGREVGCTVWIASNDHSRVWRQERLGDLSLRSLPILADSAFQRIISRIDVLWFLNDDIVAAYEVEHTTDVSTGLLRLYDLACLCPDREVYLCIVTPRDRLERVQFELSRPIFQWEGIRKRCVIISEELLLDHEEHILRWASSPAIIKRMACNDTI